MLKRNSLPQALNGFGAYGREFGHSSARRFRADSALRLTSGQAELDLNKGDNCSNFRGEIGLRGLATS